MRSRQRLSAKAWSYPHSHTVSDPYGPVCPSLLEIYDNGYNVVVTCASVRFQAVSSGSFTQSEASIARACS